MTLPATFSFAHADGPITVRVDQAHVAAHADDLEVTVQELCAFFEANLVPRRVGPLSISGECPGVIGRSRLLSTSGSGAWWGFRANRTVPTRFIAGEPMPTRLLTAWVEWLAPSELRLLTLYAGGPAPREIHDPELSELDRDASVRFWSAHALAADQRPNTWIANALSLGMVAALPAGNLHFRQISREFARSMAEGGESCVGHADTAAVFADELGREVTHNRVSLQLSIGDRVLVGQLSGARLPEGATSLPAGAAIQWFWVECGGPAS